MSITARLAGMPSLSMVADNSTNASADASSGSMNPVDWPMAAQLRCQKWSR